MAINLVNQLKEHLGGPVVRQLASHCGESESGIQAAVSVIAPTIFAALLKQVSNAAGAESLDRTLTDGGYDGSLLDDSASTFSADGIAALIEEGDGLLATLWTDGGASLTPTIANSSGIKTSSASSLLAMLTPLAMNLLGQQKHAAGLDADGLATLLSSQRENIQTSIPAGLSSAVGLGTGSGPAPAMPRPASPVSGTPVRASRLPAVLVSLVLLAIVGYGCYWYIFDGIRPTGAAGNVLIEADPMYETPQNSRSAAPSAPAPAETEDSAEPTAAEPETDAPETDAAETDAAETEAPAAASAE